MPIISFGPPVRLLAIAFLGALVGCGVPQCQEFVAQGAGTPRCLFWSQQERDAYAAELRNNAATTKHYFDVTQQAVARLAQPHAPMPAWAMDPALYASPSRRTMNCQTVQSGEFTLMTECSEW
jgi:hypothetical protein